MFHALRISVWYGNHCIRQFDFILLCIANDAVILVSYAFEFYQSASKLTRKKKTIFCFAA